MRIFITNYSNPFAGIVPDTDENISETYSTMPAGLQLKVMYLIAKLLLH
jgi:hypothetical protein